MLPLSNLTQRLHMRHFRASLTRTYAFNTKVHNTRNPVQNLQSGNGSGCDIPTSSHTAATNLDFINLVLYPTTAIFFILTATDT
jgi:hypothetical protein